MKIVFALLLTLFLPSCIPMRSTYKKRIENGRLSVVKKFKNMTYPFEYFTIFATDKGDFISCDDPKVFFDKDIAEETFMMYIYTQHIRVTDGLEEVVDDNIKFMIFSNKPPGTVDPPSKKDAKDTIVLLEM